MEITDDLRRTLRQNDWIQDTLKLREQALGVPLETIGRQIREAALSALGHRDWSKEFISYSQRPHSLFDHLGVTQDFSAFALESSRVGADLLRRADVPLRDLLKTIEETQRLFREIQPAFRFEVPEHFPKGMLRDLGVNRLHHLVGPPQSLLAAVHIFNMPAFDTSFAADIVAKLQALDDAADIEDVSAEISAAFESKAVEANKSWVGRINWLQWCWNLLSLLLPLYLAARSDSQSDQASERRHREVIQALGRVAEQLSPLPTKIPSEPSKDFYVVLRGAPLRTERRAKAPMSAWVFPNQEVRLIDISKTWAYVEFFDSLEGIPRMGWMLKKYLSKPRRHPRINSHDEASK